MVGQGRAPVLFVIAIRKTQHLQSSIQEPPDLVCSFYLIEERRCHKLCDKVLSAAYVFKIFFNYIKYRAERIAFSNESTKNNSIGMKQYRELEK